MSHDTADLDKKTAWSPAPPAGTSARNPLDRRSEHLYLRYFIAESYRQRSSRNAAGRGEPNGANSLRAGLLRRLPSRPVMVAALAACSILGVCWAAISITANVEEDAVSLAFERIEAEATTAADSIREALQDSYALTDLAERWLAEQDPQQRAVLENAMRAVTLTNASHVVTLAIVDPDGRMVWGVGGVAGPPQSAFGRASLERHRSGIGGPVVGNAFELPDKADPILPVSWRLQREGGGFAGAVFIGRRARELGQLINGIPTRMGGFAHLHGLDGKLLVQAGMKLTEGGAERFADAARDVAETDGLREITVPRLADGRTMFALLWRTAGTNLVLGIGIDADAAMRPVRYVRVAAWAGAGGVSLATLLLVAAAIGRARLREAQGEAAELAASKAESERFYTKLPAIVFHRDVAADGSSRLIYRTGDVPGVTGWLRGELADRDDWGAHVSDDVPDRRAVNRLVLQSGSAEIRWRLRQRDGSWRPMVTRLERLLQRPDGSGEVVGYVRHAPETEAEPARELVGRKELDRILALAPVVVFRGRLWISDRGPKQLRRHYFQEEFVSRSLQQVTGWTPDALTAVGGFASILDPWSTLVGALRTLRRGDSWMGELRLQRADRSMITVRITVNVVLRSDQNCLDLVGYIADITAERDAKARAIGSARLASLGEIAAGMAHELKQPLQAIALAAENTERALARGDSTAATARLARIGRFVRSAATTIEHLRRFARGSDEGVPVEPVRLDHAIEGALSILGATLHHAGIEARVELGEEVPVAVGHLVALEQVLVNLLANARDALLLLPEDAVRRITLSGGPDATGEWIVLTLSDNAGGIPQKVMDRLFEPFVTTKGAETGTGLGLSICQGLIQHMGGTITARNEAEGVVFTIRLRRSLPALPGVAEPLVAIAPAPAPVAAVLHENVPEPAAVS